MTRSRSIIAALALLPILLALAGCGGQRLVGFSGDSLYTGSLSYLQITPAAPLKPMAGGFLWSNIETDTTIPATGSVDYAVYGENGAGLVQRAGHVMVVNFTGGANRWDFKPESNTGANDVYLRSIKINGQEWNERLLYVDSAGDWFSDLWLVNGREVPERWIAKRWSRTYFGATRVVVEYREPMPACVKVSDNAGQGYTRFAIFTPEGPECSSSLEAFAQRADQAFDIQSGRGTRVTLSEADQTLLQRPALRPNMTKLVGTARARDLLRIDNKD